MRWLGLGRKEDSAVGGVRANSSQAQRKRGRVSARQRTRPIGFEALEERTLLSGGSHRLTDLAEHVGRHHHRHRHGHRADVIVLPPVAPTTPSPTATSTITLESAPTAIAAASGGQSSQALTSLTSSATTADKPQSKVWRYDDKWWGVFPQTTGTFLWRLDGTSWTQILQLSTSSTARADTLPVGDVTHVLMFRGTTSDLASVQYNPAAGTYQLWSQRPTLSTVPLPTGVETATIAMDSTGRMWVAADGYTTVAVRYSDAPYSSWSAPFDVATGISTDDISVIGALPNGNVGVMWSNENTDRFGFRLHADGTDPLVWSADEVPASQSALNVGGGMADDHLNFAIASDSTLYVAVKTSYDTAGFPEVSMLVRRPNGVWDDLYQVDVNLMGTRPIVVLNEETDCVTVIYTAADGGGNIVYRQSPTSSISFGPRTTLMNGTFNNPSSTRQNVTDELVLVVNGSGNVQGVIQTFSGITNQPPVVTAGPDQTLFGVFTTNVDGSAAGGQPNPPGTLTTAWSKLSGPGSVNFGNASAVDTTATFSEAGTYVLRLTGTDGGLSSHDDVLVTVFDFTLQTTSFQDGVFPTPAYTGSRDLRIRSGTPTTNYATNTTLGVDGSPDDAVLLKWDVTAIPQGSSVFSASFTINVTGTSTDAYEIYELKRDWVESQATWMIASTGVNWSTPGADGVSVPADRGTVVFGTVAGPTGGQMTIAFNAAGLAVIQNWINNPSANFGIVIQDYLNAGDDLGFSSSEASPLSSRPRLNVTYSTNANQAPVATADSYSVSEDGTLIVAAPGVLSNDTDGDGDPLTAMQVTAPANGSLSLAPNGSFTYTPAGNFNGSDSFTYKANDGTANSNTVTVTIGVSPVNDPPTARNDSLTTNEDTPVFIDVLTNDSDIDGNPLSVTAASDPANGSVAINLDNTITYTPDGNFNGSDSFTYDMSDGNGGTSSATVSITVSAVNDPPTAGNDSRTTNEDTPVIIDVLTNDSDIDGNALSVTSASDPANGSVAINLDNTITYTPDGNFNGGDSFTYDISDGNGGTSSATVTITITPVNDPPIANDDNPTTTVNNAVTISVLSNDTDVDGDTLSVGSATDPANGSTAVNLDGTITYTPDPGFVGSDSFDYELSDGNGGADTGTVTVTVNLVNDPPVADDDTDATNEDVSRVIAVLANDSDPNGNTLSVTAVSDPPNGTAAINPDGTITYTPDANFNGGDSFTYDISDGNGGIDSASVAITVNAVNDSPSFTKGPNQTVLQNAGPQTVAGWATAVSAGPANESTQLVTFVAMNDNNSLFANQPAVAANGTLTFTPAAGATGSAIVTLTLQDDGGIANAGSDTSPPQTFTIAVNPANPPTTVSFQEGVNGYIGTQDATIKRSNAIGNYGATTNLVAYGAASSDEASLVKWNINAIPTNVTVVSASITFLLLNGAAPPEDYEMYEVLRPWIESEITWNQPAAGATWGTAGAQGAGDHGTDVVGTVGGTVLGLITITLNQAGVAMVQRWVNTPGANNGIIIQDYSATDWTSLGSSEYSSVTKRPTLTITYQ